MINQGSWRHEPQEAVEDSASSRGEEAQHNLDLEAGGNNVQSESSHLSGQSSSHHEAMSHSVMRASRPSVKECLNVPDEEMSDLSLDVYNMFFLSNIQSQAFVYSLVVLITKIALYVLLFVDITRKEFPFDQRIEAAPEIKAAQFFLMPVAIVTQEELITSFFIFAHLKYSPEVRKRHPGAYKWKYIVAHCTRCMDGLIFLFINICVMLLQINDVLGLFLNFAALMFLQTIDNIALQICLDGYCTRSLKEAAQDVVDMKFAYRHHYVHSCMQSSFVVVVWASMIAIWSKVHFGRDYGGNRG